MRDVDHLSFSATSGHTAVVFRGYDGSWHGGPREDFNAWTEENLITRSTPAFRFGNKALQIGQWRIREIDDTHFPYLILVVMLLVYIEQMENYLVITKTLMGGVHRWENLNVHF